MSQHSENDDSDDDYYFLQPVSNQYNITDKIKEANQELYKGEKFQRSTQPKVRFRDHQLVDYEPEEDEVGVELMEKRSSITIHNTISTTSSNSDIIVRIKEEESSDDGYIEDEAIPDSERIVVESIEIEEVCEQIEILETSFEDVLKDDMSTNDDETYTKDDFHDDSIESVIVTTNGMRTERKHQQQRQTRDTSPPPQQQTKKGPKKVFRTKINPSIDDMSTPTSATIISPPTAPSIIEKRATSARTKPCCQNNNEYKQKLPKYNGYSSNYGLSKEQFDRRRFNQLRNLEIQEYRETRQIEQKEYVAKVNEEAFAKWLRKKMRYSVNKSNPMNMYDVKPSTKQRFQIHGKRRQITRQMETEENDDEDDESEVLPEEGDEEI